MGLQALLASIGGVLSILAILTYPVGLFKLWLQLDRDYTHDLRTAWYAASLISPTEVAGQAVMLLSLSCLAVGISLALAVATLSLMGRGRYGFFSPVVQDRNSKKVTIYTG